MAEEGKKAFSKTFAPFPDDIPELKGPLPDGTFVRPTNGLTHLFYRHKEGQWEWTPYADKDVWMPVSSATVTEGKLKGKKPAHFNLELIHYLHAHNPTPPAGAAAVTLEDVLEDVKKNGMPNSFSRKGEEGGQVVSKMQAMTGAAKAQDICAVVGVNDSKNELKAPELASTHTVAFNNCTGSEFVIQDYHTKMTIDRCKNCKFIVNGKSITQVLEIFSCDDCEVVVNTRIQTLQVDKCNNIKFVTADEANYTQLVYAGACGLHITVGAHTLETGVDKMKATPEEGKTFSEDIDQFVCRVVKDKLIVEKLVRLANGFPSTERESKQYNERQEENMKAFAKNAGITFYRKEQKVGREAGRNDPCPCGSGHKFKKCCLGKERD